MNVTRDIGSHADKLITLAAAASSTYDSFVYDDPAQAKATQELLFQSGASEFSPPFASLVFDDGELTAMAAAMMANQVASSRMRAAMALSRAPWFTRTSNVRRRSQLAGRTFFLLEASDFYISRIAVEATARGKGYASSLLNQIESEAREAAATRLTLDVSPDKEAAIRLYTRLGFELIGQGETHDAQTGRTLVHLHMAKSL